MFDIQVNQIKNTNLTDVKEAQEEAGLDKNFNYNAFYMAIVEDTNDPLRLGRVKIRIPALHGGTPDNSFYLDTNSLPWAKPAALNGAGNDVGQFIVPTKGTRVFVTFEYDSADHPIYFGGVITKAMQTTKSYNDNPEVFDGEEFIIGNDDRISDIDGEAYQVVYKSFKGATILINDKDGEETLKIIDAAGQQIIMKNTDEYPLPRRENLLEPPATASIDIITNGKLGLSCDDLQLQAETTNLEDYIHTEGTGDKNFIYTQAIASSNWNITHNLGKYPSVTVVDSAGSEVVGNVNYIDLNRLTVSFNAEFAGKAYLN